MTKNHSEHLLYHVPEDERPMEKFRKFGAGSLTDAELLALLIRSGTQGCNALNVARALCTMSERYPGILGLCHTSLEELETIRGIGHVKAVQLMCIAELSRRIARARTAATLDFRYPETIAEHYMEDMRHADREEVRLLLLDTRLRLIKEKIMSIGTINMSAVSAREICREALLADAVSMILIHNHPSGDPSPSEDDLKITERVRKAGSLIGVPLLDHLIIGDHCFVSLNDCMKDRKGLSDS